MEFESKELAKKIVKAADDKKAEDISVLEMKGISILADYFVVCSGSSDTQVKAILNSIEQELSEYDIEPQSKEGNDVCNWVVLDYADVIVHIFHEEEREYYQLEKLWGDAEQLDSLKMIAEA